MHCDFLFVNLFVCFLFLLVLFFFVCLVGLFVLLCFVLFCFVLFYCLFVLSLDNSSAFAVSVSSKLKAIPNQNGGHSRN